MAELDQSAASSRGKGISYTVVKNRLGKIAAEQAGRSEFAPLLSGPSAVALGGADEAALAKGVLDALRPFRNVVIRGGAIGGTTIDADAVTRLATLPPRDVLLGQLAGGFASPLEHHGGAAVGAAAQPGLCVVPGPRSARGRLRLSVRGEPVARSCPTADHTGPHD